MVYHEDSLKKACRDLEQDLILYYYGECAEGERSRVAAHLRDCGRCRGFLDDLGNLLPLTVRADEPPEALWQDYSMEMRARLASAEQKRRWQGVPYLLSPWPMSAMVMGLVLILAVALTFFKGRWDSRHARPAEEVLEVLPIVENLEFFETMELLDALEKPEGSEVKKRPT